MVESESKKYKVLFSVNEIKLAVFVDWQLSQLGFHEVLETEVSFFEYYILRDGSEILEGDF
jgi:hypothetical protein